MKAVTYEGIYSPIVKNNGVEVVIMMEIPGIGAQEITVPYKNFTPRQQKMLARNTTCVEYKEVTSYMDPNVKVKIPVNTPQSCDPSTEQYWSM